MDWVETINSDHTRKKKGCVSRWSASSVGSTRGAAAASMSPPHTTASRRGSTARAGHGRELQWSLRPPQLPPQPQAKVRRDYISSYRFISCCWWFYFCSKFYWIDSFSISLQRKLDDWWRGYWETWLAVISGKRRLSVLLLFCRLMLLWIAVLPNLSWWLCDDLCFHFEMFSVLINKDQPLSRLSFFNSLISVIMLLQAQIQWIMWRG